MLWNVEILGANDVLKTMWWQNMRVRVVVLLWNVKMFWC